jgi:hypothetical protein
MNKRKIGKETVQSLLRVEVFARFSHINSETMAKGLRSKSRRKNQALKRERLKKKEDARFERIAQIMQQETGVGPDTMGSLFFLLYTFAALIQLFAFVPKFLVFLTLL